MIEILQMIGMEVSDTESEDSRVRQDLPASRAVSDLSFTSRIFLNSEA